MKTTMKQCFVMTASGLLFSCAACAQYAPDTSADLETGYGQIALGQSTLQGTRNLDAKASSQSAAPRQTAQVSQERMQALMRSVKPEYDLRVRRDGKASADRWLQETAYAMGQREGRKLRAGRARTTTPDAPSPEQQAHEQQAQEKTCKHRVWQTRYVAAPNGGSTMIQVPVCRD